MIGSRKDIFDKKTRMSDRIIELDKINKTYIMGSEKIQALRSISLSVNKNEYVALMGASGSGKSTLMNMLGCLDTPTSGEYKLRGNAISTLSSGELAAIRNKEIGFVFQTFNLLPRMTAWDNVALPLVYSGMGKKLRLEKAAFALETVGLKDRITHRPNELSGGQRQRVALARALVNDPAIILADEPTGNLDSRTSYEIMGIFEEIHSKGNTVILVTHEPDIAEYTHRIIRLIDGLVESDIVNRNIRKFDPSMLEEE